MSSTAKGSTPENKSTKRQNPDDRLLSLCRLSIGEGVFFPWGAVPPGPPGHGQHAGAHGPARGHSEASVSDPDRWHQMALQLAGEALPEPPALEGQVYRQAWRVPDDKQQLEREAAAAAVWWALVREAQRP